MDILWGVFKTIGYFLKSSNHCDFIILYHISFITILPFYFIKLFKKQKFIVILPEFYEKPEAPFYKYQSLNWWNFYLGIKYLAGIANGFVVLTYYLEKFIKNRYGSEIPIIILPGLVDTEDFAESNFKEKYNSIITIGYVGTPTHKDGVIHLLESFAQLLKEFDNCRLNIIGDITNGGSVLPSLKMKAKSLNIEDKVEFKGLVEHHRVPDLLSECDILTLTRPNGIFAEAGFPSKLGEYFAAKRPIVITNVGDVPHYFTHGKELVIVEPESIYSIVEGFKYLINYPSDSRTIAINGFKWMTDNLKYKEAINKILNFINENFNANARK